MSSRKRAKATGRKESGPFLAVPKRMLDSPNYTKLTFKARAMLLELARQYNGSNNGDLCATYNTLKDRGFGSKETIFDAIRELEVLGFIVRTRQGGKNLCNLFAITWKPIDECSGKLDVKPTITATNDFLERNFRVISGSKQA